MTKVALLGAGWAGAVHAMASNAVRGGHVTQVVSRTVAGAQRLVDGSGAESSVGIGTYAELQPGTEVAIVATPASHHLEAARLALGAGCAVLVEKPLAVDVAEADELIAAAEASGKLCGYAENLLFAPAYLALAEHARRIGPLHRLHLRFHNEAPAWGHFTEALPGGGVLHDLGAHPIALALALADSEPQSVTCTVRSRREDGADDEASMAIRFTSGLEATIDVSWTATRPDWAVEIASDAGAGRWEVFPDPLLELDGEDATPRATDAAAPDDHLISLGYVAQLQGFVDAVAGRGGSVCPLGFGRLVAEVTAAGYASDAAGGAPQPIRSSPGD